ncbi:homocysteine S-methyltransferase family protein [Synechocystis sp. LKSZ1]|uniref:homocysteine S-methyltransferase family protein n=1 Tax=Synechocystis sp. LKSZ1 TaxID=3144951 RepID=UPI00336C0AD9
MSKYRNHLPQLDNDLFITDGGMETTLIFHEGWELRDFAAFDLLNHPAGRQSIQNYYRTYIDLAKTYAVGLILESATWRANSDWGTKLGYHRQALAEANRQAIALLQDLRQKQESPTTPLVISGCVGPRGDGYNAAYRMSEAGAERYHRPQIATFAETAADLVTAMTINYVEEAIGIVRAAQAYGMPVVISFTVETDGRLPSGQSLQTAIEQVDQATQQGPLYYMINCAHPSHFASSLTAGTFVKRIRGIRANASKKSHAELDEATVLDDGNPADLGSHYQTLRKQFPHVNVLGGCCGTDHRHIEAICQACLPLVWPYFTQRPLLSA